MQRRLLFTMVEGAPDRFSVNGDDLSFETGLRLRLGPRGKTVLEGLCIDQTKNPAEPVTGRNPMLQV